MTTQYRNHPRFMRERENMRQQKHPAYINKFLTSTITMISMMIAQPISASTFDGYWNFNGGEIFGFRDNSAAANHGYFVQSTRGQYREGLYGLAIDKEIFVIPSITVVNTYSPMTFSLWVYADGSQTSALVSKQKVATSQRLALEWVGNALRFQLSAGDDQRIIVQSQQTVTVNTWTHVAVTYGGSGFASDVSIYINGELSDVNILEDSLITPADFLGPLIFGGSITNNRVFNGAMDEILIAPVAYTASQISCLAEEGPACWTAVGVGPQGPKGEVGDPGEIGDTGVPGDAGAKGEQGPAGSAGPKGIRGIQGPPGLPGPAGDVGEPGADGANGIDGVDGVDGSKGPRGPKGRTGIAGPKGDRGPQGEQGETGPIGLRGVKGDRGPRGLKGHQGAQGETGDKGATGRQGLQGYKGSPGNKGPRGDKGNRGPTGDPGPRGDRGPTGVQGNKGPRGERGPTGPKGDRGRAGHVRFCRDNYPVSMSEPIIIQPVPICFREAPDESKPN